MADVTKTTRQLKLLAGFSDEDDRTITLDNPKQNITWAQIENLATYAAPVLIGDKYGASFTRFKEAKYVEGTTIYVDTD